MPRAYRHLTWRVLPRHKSLSALQALAPTGLFDVITSNPYYWVTVAHGKYEHLKPIAEALNRARFTLFDIRPAKRTAGKMRKNR